MALTDKEREDIKNSISVMREIQGKSEKNFDKVNEGYGSGKKMTTLKEIQEFIDSTTLLVNGVNSIYGTQEKIKVSMYFMSNNNVTLGRGSDNYIEFTFGYNYDMSIMRVNCYPSVQTLEDFIKLPKNIENPEKGVKVEDIVEQCDSEVLYDRYQPKALELIRSRMSSVYRMMTGGNMYKVKENFPGNTLYVTYDSIMKKFKYSYNTDFVLECVLDEWAMSRGSYNNLESCYTYVLAFLMTHEMLHIIHHNTSSDGSGNGDALDVIKDHAIVNTIMDSFINCNISKIFRGVKGLNSSYSDLAPMPKIGVGSEVVVRGEHNKGFKSFKNATEVGEAIGKILKNFSGKSDMNVRVSMNSQYDVSVFAGADIFLSVDINPEVNFIRGNNSTLYQSVVNDIVKELIDGNVYGKYDKYEDKEKIEDVEKLKDGQLVVVRNVKGIFAVKSYDSVNKVYTIEGTDITGTHTIVSDGVELTVVDYAPNGKILGERTRDKIKPYNPEKDAYETGDGTRQSDKIQTSLTPRDIEQINTPEGGKGGTPGPTPENNVKHKVLNVGDYVWVARKQKFGRITSISNGKFEVEEVHEIPATIIDDSLNH